MIRKRDPILLVEDDSVDIMTIKRAVKELDMENPIVVSNNGEEALDYLTSNGNPLPCFIILDLNMPKMNGIDFLKAVKKDEKLKMLPVIILTTSTSKQDVEHTFDLGAAGYMVKKADYAEFVNTVKSIKHYWSLSLTPEM